MGIIFKRLELRNFLSFGNALQEINLEASGSYFIVGENIDTQSANGAGKTSILNAISYALYNKPIANISKERLINKTNNAKNTRMEVRLVFTKNGNEYEVYRCRGETYSIELFENGKDVTPDSVTACDKKIIDTIGISYELFRLIVIFSGNDIPFLDMPIAGQRTLIEELFNINLLSEKAIKLKEIIRQTESDIAVQKALHKQAESLRAAQEKRIEDAKNRMLGWDKTKLQDILTLQNQLESISKVDFETEELLHAELESLLPNHQILIRTVDEITRNKKSHEKKLVEIEQEITDLGDATCPYCKQHFEGAEEKIIELEPILITHMDEVEKLESDEPIEKRKLLESQQRIDEIRNNLVYRTTTEFTKAKSSVAFIEAKLKNLELAENPHIDAYHAAVNEEKIVNVDEDDLDDLVSILEHQQFLLKLLTDKNSFIRKKIINRSIPFLNDRVNYYTNILGLPHVVKFSADMSCVLSELGRELDFGNLSSGEKKRVNFSLSLAFRDVFHHLHDTINVLFMDEIDGGSVSTEGVESMIKLIKDKSRDDDIGIWVISHRQEMLGRFNTEITIRKENGFSSIISNEI